MVDPLPAFEPYELWGLSYRQAVSAAKHGMAIRREHWCSPVVIYEGGRLLLDDDGELSPFELMPGDRSAKDWNCQKRADTNGGDHGK